MGKVLKSWTSIELKMFKKYISRDIKNGLVTGMELKNCKNRVKTIKLLNCKTRGMQHIKVRMVNGGNA
jgi:hypothetical protein